MRWTRVAVGSVVIAAAMLTAGDVLADRPGSGGGGTPPAGTIYAWDLADNYSPTEYGLLSMDGDGENRTTLTRMATPARPSRALHGGKRWFLTQEAVPGEVLQGTVRRDIFAVREDGEMRVRLTSASTMQYWSADWAPDEDESGATIGMLAREWTGTTSSDTVIDGSCAFYTTHLSFDGAGDVVGLDADPVQQIDVGVAGSHPFFRPDVWSWSWAPNMEAIVVERYRDGSPPRLRTIDISSSLTDIGEGEQPTWSPDGTKIACHRFVPGSTPSKDSWIIETIDLHSFARTTLVSVRPRVSASTSQYVFDPKWAPGGTHIVYQYLFEKNGLRTTKSIYRVAADGTGNTNLTPDVLPPSSGAGVFGIDLVDWR